MLLGLGFTGAYGANAKAWKSEVVNATTYPDINADIRYAQLAEKGKFQFIFEDALKADKENGVFADYSQVKPVYISGKHIQANGALPIPPSPQGQPVIFHSGRSPNSIAFAGRYGKWFQDRGENSGTEVRLNLLTNDI
ncbi:hypothetical protein [Paenibacillus amylolyticus]|uniref:hypothetical protein n=1 Tax=Paenibacillus amylolyticus TaxID=1451 RepID=UPI003241CB41